MNRPGIGLVLAWSLAMMIASSVHAQAVSIVPTTTTNTTGSSGSAMTPSASPMDFSAMNWRFGLVSPYAQQPVSGSATRQNTVPPPSATPVVTTNPFVGATLGTQGSLITAGSTSSRSTSSTSSVAGAASSGRALTTISSSYAPRFVSFETLVPNFGVTPPIEQAPAPVDESANLIRFTSNNIGAAFSSIPEPSTLMMCAGLLAMIGYGYSRRGMKTGLKPTGETTESVNV